jgi:hypothetical protein
MSKSEVDSCAVLDEPFLQDYVDQLEKSRKIIYKTLFSTDSKFQLNCDSLGFVHVWLIENNLKRNNTLEIVLPLKLKKVQIMESSQRIYLQHVVFPKSTTRLSSDCWS